MKYREKTGFFLLAHVKVGERFAIFCTEFLPFLLKAY